MKQVGYKNYIHSFFNSTFHLCLIILLTVLLGGCLSGDSSSDPEDSEGPDESVNVEEQELHKAYFTENTYTGTGNCLECHQSAADHVLQTGHWKWQGVSSNIENHESEIHGKNTMINNFCIAVQSNEGRCSQCHIGYGYSNKDYDFDQATNIDCLVCHDQSGTYKKSKTAAGQADASVDLGVVAQSVGANQGVPQRANCIPCHANAGGGDNVKHGDLSSALISTTRDYDVHMGEDGADFTCIRCHDQQRTAEGDILDHGIGGMPFHSVDEGYMKHCSDCHGDNTLAHVNVDMGRMFVAASGKLLHQRLSCQVCHIPSVARQVATKTYWDWSTAGDDIDPVPVDPVSGRPTYDKKKGTFEWQYNVRPVLRVHNGKWNRMLLNVNDDYTALPVVLAQPAADNQDASAKIYPFKLMRGKQIADADNYTMLVPHLFGLTGGPNPYWARYDWDLALIDGADYTGQIYSGNFEFVDTEMYLTVNHEVAPAEMSLGKNGECDDCHNSSQIDWSALGWDEDPYIAGGGG